MAEKVKKPKSKARKIVEWVLFSIFGAACAFVLAANISAMIHKKENYGQSIRFGVGTFVILTDSMEPEINKNDLIITVKEKVDKFEERINNGEKIDVTFMNVNVDTTGLEPTTEVFKGHSPTNATNTPMTHRLREVHVNLDKEYGEGRYLFVASGINIGGYEAEREYQYQAFTEKEYLGTVRMVNPFMGKFMNFISSPFGLIILLLIPGGYLIVVSSLDIFKAVKEEEQNSNENTVQLKGEHLSNLSEEERQRLKNELLEQMLEEKKGGKK